MRRPSRSDLPLVIVPYTNIPLAAQYVEFNGIEKLLSLCAILSTHLFYYSAFCQSSRRPLYYSLNTPFPWIKVYTEYISLSFPHFFIINKYHFLDSGDDLAPEENSLLSHTINPKPLYRMTNNKQRLTNINYREIA